MSSFYEICFNASYLVSFMHLPYPNRYSLLSAVIQLQMIILKAQPSLIGRCVSVVNLPWGEADASFKFMCALGHLTHLCDNCDTDPLLRSAIKQAASAKGVKSDGAIKKVLDDVMQSMIPAGEKYV